MTITCLVISIISLVVALASVIYSLAVLLKADKELTAIGKSKFFEKIYDDSEV